MALDQNQVTAVLQAALGVDASKVRWSLYISICVSIRELCDRKRASMISFLELLSRIVLSAFALVIAAAVSLSLSLRASLYVLVNAVAVLCAVAAQ